MVSTAQHPERSRWRMALRIAAAAWLILFIELALIRFLAGYVRVFAFYTNFVIIAAFLGMGTGMLRRRSASELRWLFPVAIGLLFAFVAFLASVTIDVRPDHLEWLWGAPDRNATGRHVPLSVAVVGLFTLSTAVFVPLGAMLGAAMSEWRALPAYAADLGGSLLGVVTFALASGASLGPVSWFATGLVVWLVLAWSNRWLFVTSVAASAVVLGITRHLGSMTPETWSPYYRITLEPGPFPGSTTLNVNGALHQVMIDFRRSGESAPLAAQRSAYERPYRFVRKLDTALVVGAGTGNDVALLLSLGATHVDAIEIDPAIAGIGIAQHPMRPYEDPRVHLVTTDARAYLRSPPHRYDVVTFGTLDSQTLLGGMTSVRLDNYVYTLESFQSARDALAPGGTLVVYHLSGLWFISARLFQNMEKAFGAAPRVFAGDDGLFTYTFIAGAGGAGAEPVAADAPLRMQLKLSTDDWPFPYLRGRRIPSHYLVVLAAVLALGAGFVVASAGPTALRRPNWPLFLIGAGFLLLETKGITTLSLLFGSTWTVNAAVIGGILAVALAAALATDRARAPTVRTAMIALAVLLILGLVVHPASLASAVPGMRWVVAAAYVGLPVLFASFIFARAYDAQPDPTGALAYNILGAVAGGVAEYASMSFGLDALTVLALGAYLAAVALLPAGVRQLTSRTA